MSLNIKSREAHRLAQELAKQNGETLTAAVTIALQERLARQQTNPKAGLAAWLDELTKRSAPLLNDLPPSDQIGDLLFDRETGLPL